MANANRALDHSKNSILTFRQYGKRFQKSGVNAPLTYRYPFQDVALLGDLGAWRLTDFFQDYARWILRFGRIVSGLRPQKSLADAETGENLTEQVIGGEFAGYAGKRALSKSEFLGKQFKLGNAGGCLVNVGLRRLQSL